MARLANTEISFFKQVPVANGMVPVFRNYNDQLADFNSRRAVTISNTLYIDVSRGYVDVGTDGGEFDNALQMCNYLGFFNNYFENKHFFCKISGLKKITTNTTRVSFVVDAFQTFMFDFSMKSSMIKRQHLSQPQWDRAVANPYRSDIQELTTDEGVALTSADEVAYWDGRTDVEESISQGGFKGTLGTYGGALSRLDDGRIAGSAKMAFDIGDAHRRDKSVPPTFAACYDLWDKYEKSGDVGAEKYWKNMAINHVQEFSRVGVDVNTAILEYSGDFFDSTMLADGAVKQEIDVDKFILTIQKASNKTTISSLQNIYKLPVMVWMAIVNGRHPERMVFPLSKLGLVDKYYEIPGYGNIEDPKLYRAPFRFIRVTTPGGDDVEHRLENFADPMNPSYTFQGDVTTAVPVMYCIPRNYNGAATAWNNAVTFDQYPILPFFTSGFQQYINEQNRQRILGDSASAKRARDNTQRSFKDTMEGVQKGGLGGLITGAMDIAQDVYNGYSAVKAGLTNITKGPEAAYEASIHDTYERAATQQAYDTLGGKGGKHKDYTGGESYSGVYAHQRSAFIGMGEQHQGKLDNLKLVNGYDDFEFRYVTYQPYIIKGLDKVFKVYGYRCDYYNVPRVYDYIRNVNETPRFVNVDGMTFTYCQTESCGVYGVQDWACSEIESVFNAGARFTQGFQ